MSPPIPVLAQEYRELQAFYVRCIEVQEAILSRPGFHTHALLPQLLFEYSNVTQAVAHLVVFLVRQLAEDPALWHAWREASTRLKP